VPMRNCVYFFWMILACCVVCDAQAQQSGELPQEAIDRATQLAADSVVQIETIGGLEQVGQKLANTGPTTGTVLSDEGWIIASSYSFQQAPAAIVVRTKDGNRQSAKLIARDRSRELVLLKTDASPLLKAIVPAPPESIQVGESSLALGKVFDPARPSVSVGVVSAIGRVWGKAIQTDTRISPNNYGGPLIDLQGRCLGILAPLNPGDGSPEDGTQWYDSGIGFAAASDQVLRGFEELKTGKDVLPGRIGVSLSTQDDYSGPVFVAGAAANSPAAEAGLKRGDRFLEINGRPIEMLAHLKLQLGVLNAGESARLKIQRGPEQLEIQCKLVAEIPPYRPPYLGIIPSLDANNQVIVKSVIADSPAAKIGLAKGDRFIELAGTPITSIRELTDLLQNQSVEKPTPIVCQRDGTTTGLPQTVQLEAWPTDPVVKLADDEKPISAPAQPPAGTGVIDLPLGDVANKCFAFVPPTYTAEVPHGVLIILPEAGEIDQRAFLDQWEPLCRSHRWILAVLSSADKKAWTRDEIELVGRSLTLLQTNYNVDPHRVATLGIRSASPLAIVAAFGQRTKFNALIVLGGEFPPRGNVPAGQPQECIRTLIVNDSDGNSDVAEKLTDLGHPTGTLQATVEAGGKVPAASSEIIQLWLRGLERL
jgi:serine protease Do